MNVGSFSKMCGFGIERCPEVEVGEIIYSEHAGRGLSMHARQSQRERPQEGHFFSVNRLEENNFIDIPARN